MAEGLRLGDYELTAWLGLARPTLPHLTTYQRVLSHLELVEVESVVSRFFRNQLDTGVVSLEGQTLRGTMPAGQTQGTYLRAAYVVE